jgi:hypothetical protein
MTQMHFLMDWVQIAVIASFLASAFFPVSVSFFYPWWETALGWNLVSLDGALALALLPSFLHQMFGVNITSVWFLYLIAVSISAIPPIVLWRTWIIYRAQRAGAVNAREGARENDRNQG